ncbi:MAG: glycosyltransferase family 25 protein [Hyphomicrobiales bacterium]|nr:glycosyltransferase family 25 protein [Hyphomicrobiales bacterium]
MYVINTQKSQDRMLHMQNMLHGMNVDFSRVDAIDGDDLTESDLAYWQSRSRVWAPLTANEIACFLSHRKSWQLVVERGEHWAFICEDDIHVCEAFEQFVRTPTWLPEKADIVKAETVLERVELDRNPTSDKLNHALRKLNSEHLGAAAYFVSLDACKRLLQLTDEICEPVDCLLFSSRAPIMCQLEVYQIDPALCIQDRFLAREGQGLGLVSQIPLTRFDKVAPVGFNQWASKLWLEAKRPLRQFAGLVRRKALTAIGRSVFKVVPIHLAQRQE